MTSKGFTHILTIDKSSDVFGMSIQPKINSCGVRGRPFITFAKFSGFCTPPPTRSHFHATYQYYLHIIGHFSRPPSPLGANVING